jgi:hypothetical protein
MNALACGRFRVAYTIRVMSDAKSRTHPSEVQTSNPNLDTFLRTSTVLGAVHTSFTVSGQIFLGCEKFHILISHRQGDRSSAEISDLEVDAT